MDPYLSVLIKILIGVVTLQTALLFTMIYRLGRLEGRITGIDIHCNDLSTKG